MFNIQIAIGEILDNIEMSGVVYRDDYDLEEEYEADTGHEYTTFRIASWCFEINQDGENTKKTVHHNVDVYDSKLAKICYANLKKGDLVLVIGKNRNNNWEDNGVRHTRSYIAAEVVKSVNDYDEIKKYINGYVNSLKLEMLQ